MYSLLSALKLSRSYLSTLPGSLLHWGAHAALERIRGRPQEARKIYETILVSSAVSPDQSQLAIQLWWDWAQMEWLAGDSEKAKSVLLRSVEAQSTEGIQLLRAKRKFLDRCDDASTWESRHAWIKARALFEFLTSSNITSSLIVFDEYLDKEQVKGFQHECLTVSSLLLVYYHLFVLKNPGKPSILRDRASNALDIYPSNSIVVGLFLEGEKGQGVWGRVRAFLAENEAVEKDMMRRAIEIWIPQWEKGRWESEIERTRNGLTLAVETEQYVPLRYHVRRVY